MARASRNYQSFFLNGRYIRHASLNQAVDQACRERVTIGHYPICVLYITMPGEWADVNVHPNKLDVRFREEERVTKAVFDAISAAFPAQSTFAEVPPEMTLARDKQPQELPKPTLSVTETEAASAADDPPSFSQVVQSYFSTMPEPPARSSVRESSSILSPRQAPDIPFAPYPEDSGGGESIAPLPENVINPPPEEKESLYFRLIGVAFSTYLILEMEGRLWFIDQHAAHERIMYERLMRALNEGEGSQQLLTADLVPLTPAQADQLLTYQKELREAGFEVELMGHDAAQLRAVPMVLGEPQARAAFLDVLEHLGELRPIATRQKRRDAILQMACKKAIKAGDALSHAEIEELLREMKENDAPPTCPHGRPLVVALTRLELEKRFKRVQ